MSVCGKLQRICRRPHSLPGYSSERPGFDTIHVSRIPDPRTPEPRCPRCPIVTLAEMSPGQRGRPVPADDRQGGVEDQDGQALLSRRLSRRQPRGELSHLGRFALGRRLPRPLDARRVLQAPRRLPRDQLRPATGNPQDPRGRSRPTRPTASIPAMCLPRIAVRSRRRCSTSCWRSPGEQICERRAAAAGRVDPARPTATRCWPAPAARHNHHAYVGGLLGAHAERHADVPSSWPTSTPSTTPT